MCAHIRGSQRVVRLWIGGLTAPYLSRQTRGRWTGSGPVSTSRPVTSATMSKVTEDNHCIKRHAQFYRIMNYEPKYCDESNLALKHTHIPVILNNLAETLTWYESAPSATYLTSPVNMTYQCRSRNDIILNASPASARPGSMTLTLWDVQLQAYTAGASDQGGAKRQLSILVTLQVHLFTLYCHNSSK